MASLSVVACTAADETDTATDTNASDVIGGIDATSAEFNAIGQLAFRGNDGNGSNCTGTLISPTVVLTAKHCVMDKPGEEGSGFRLEKGRVYFILGQNAHHPLGVVEVKSVTTSSIFRGGYTGLGSDVALYTLKTPITSIPPLEIADRPPSAADVNTSFIAIGYGTQDAAGTSSTRKTGAVRLRTVSGQPAHDAFPTVEAYIASQELMAPGAMTAAQLEATKKHYDSPLSNDYEIYVGAPSAQGEVQICHGDSGGPLLRRDNGKLVIYGVASTTFGQTANRFCRDGSMYATFGASTREFIAKGVGDHCAAEPKTGALACGLDTAPTSCVAIEGDGTPPADGSTPAPLSPFAQCLATSCCSETTACFADAECSALSQCFRDCSAAGTEAAATTACNTACYQARAGQYARYLAYQVCGKKNCSTPAPASTP